MTSLIETLQSDGFAVHRAGVEDEVLLGVRPTFDRAIRDGAGTRDGLDDEAVFNLATSDTLGAIVEPILGNRAFPFRATLFDKSATRNWPVAWHQDRFVALEERVDSPLFRSWSRKGRKWSAEPPEAVLAGLLAVRVDLDGSGPGNGGLRLIPGSHRDGVLTPGEIESQVQSRTVACPALAAGDVLLMRPLTLHSSGRSHAAGRRRVIHIEFAARALPGGARYPVPLGHIGYSTPSPESAPSPLRR